MTAAPLQSDLYNSAILLAESSACVALRPTGQCLFENTITGATFVSGRAADS